MSITCFFFVFSVLAKDFGKSLGCPNLRLSWLILNNAWPTGEGASELFKDPKNKLGSSKYSQKDSWNPADIWLIRKQVSGKRFDDPTSLGTDKLAFKQAIMRAKDNLLRIQGLTYKNSTLSIFLSPIEDKLNKIAKSIYSNETGQNHQNRFQ